MSICSKNALPETFSPSHFDLCEQNVAWRSLSPVSVNLFLLLNDERILDRG